MTFEQMIDLAKKKVASLETHPADLPDPQVTVLETKKGGIYVAENNTLPEELASQDDTAVAKMVTVWKGGYLDLSSGAVRAELLLLNPENAETEFMMSGGLVRRIKHTLPHIMPLFDIVAKMKESGIRFEKGLTKSDFSEIERIYGIVFPYSLRVFYRIGLPVSDDLYEFVRWNDYSEENVSAVKERIANPYEWLKRDIEKGFRLPGWQGDAEDILRGAPTLIPIYRHRYMPMIDDADAPVLSTVGRDTIWYGANLCDYLQREFLNYETGEEIKVSEQVAKRARPWSDIVAN